jgi:hypothetical protein
MIVRTAEQIRRGAARPGRRHVRPGGVLGVATLALAAVGCSIPGPQHPASAVEPLRQSIQVGAPVDAQVSVLRSGPPDGQRLILVHGTPGAASEWADFLLDPIANLQVVATADLLQRWDDSNGDGRRQSAANCHANTGHGVH